MFYDRAYDECQVVADLPEDARNERRVTIAGAGFGDLEGTVELYPWDAADGTPATPVAGLRFDETVLVVEDDEVVRQQVCRILERQGFTVLAAGDGDEALALVDKHHSTIELLLTDVIMPHMNGRELYRQLRERQPATRVLYMSGYADDVIAEHGVLGAEINFVQKPFTVAELIDKIIDALELGSLDNRKK